MRTFFSILLAVFTVTSANALDTAGGANPVNDPGVTTGTGKVIDNGTGNCIEDGSGNCKKTDINPTGNVTPSTNNLGSDIDVGTDNSVTQPVDANGSLNTGTDNGATTGTGTDSGVGTGSSSSGSSAGSSSTTTGGGAGTGGSQ